MPVPEHKVQIRPILGNQPEQVPEKWRTKNASLRAPKFSAQACQGKIHPSRVSQPARNAGVGKLFQVVVVGQAGHLRSRRLESGIRPLERARAGPQPRVCRRGLHRRAPIIEPGPRAGGARRQNNDENAPQKPRSPKPKPPPPPQISTRFGQSSRSNASPGQTQRR